MKKGRPGTGSDADVRSIKSVNVAEVMSHRTVSSGELILEPSVYRKGEEEDDETVFAWTISQHEAPRTIDSGYGFETRPVGDGEGIEGGWQDLESRSVILNNETVIDVARRHLHSTEHAQEQLQQQEELHRTKEVCQFG